MIPAGKIGQEWKCIFKSTYLVRNTSYPKMRGSLVLFFVDSSFTMILNANVGQ